MNRDEIRKLLGGYATGTLTQSEQKLLFEAALDDQELFDELSREQELKELIELPGARSRLIAALEPAVKEEKAWWAKPWPWAAAATVAMGVVVAVAIWPRPHKVELFANARNAAPAPGATPVSSPVEAAPAPAAAKPPAERRKATEPAGPAPILLDRREQPRADEAKTEKKSEPEKDSSARDVKEVKDTAVREVAVAAPPPSPIVAPQQARQNALPTDQPPMAQQSQLAQTQGQLRARAQSEEPSRDRAAPRAPEQAGGGGSGRAASSGFANRPAAALGAAKAKAAQRVAFEYRFDGSGHLDLTPLSDGFLIVTLSNDAGTRAPYALGSQGRAVTGRPIRINLTDRTVSVDVVFAELNIARDFDALAKQQFRAETKESGLIEDPTPSPNSRLSITLQVPKR